MDYKKIIEAAVIEADKTCPCSDHEAALKKIRERAEKMKKDENIEVKKLVEIEVPEVDVKQHRRRAGFAVGTAAAVAAAAGLGFFTGTRVPAGVSASPLAGSSFSPDGSGYVAEVLENSAVPLSELVGKTVTFSDFEIEITAADYDGHYLRVDFETEWEEGTEPYKGTDLKARSVVLEPLITAGADLINYRDTISESRYIGVSGSGRHRYSYIYQMHSYHGTYKDLYIAYYRADGIDDLGYPVLAKEQVKGLTVRAEAPATEEEDRQIINPLYGKDTDLGGRELRMLWVTPLVAEIEFAYTNDDAGQQALENEPEVYAVTKDGKVPMSLGYGRYTGGAGDEVYMRYKAVPEDSGADLTECVGIEINGRLFGYGEEDIFKPTTEVVTTVTTTATATVSNIPQTESGAAEDEELAKIISFFEERGVEREEIDRFIERIREVSPETRETAAETTSPAE